MNDVQAYMADFDKPVEKLMKHSLTELRGMFEEFVVGSLVRLAQIVEAMRRKGDDLSWMPTSMRTNCLRIARGELSAKALRVFAGTGSLGATISQLPLAEQERLAEGGTVEVYAFADGEVDKRLGLPLDMDRDDVMKVFDVKNGRIRDAVGQRAWVESQRERARRLPRDFELFPNRKHHTLDLYVDGKRARQFKITDLAILLGEAK